NSGGVRARSCLGCPGCPPRWRLSCPCGGGVLGGLTISEDGGLEEVEEFLRAAASWAWTWARAAWSWATVAVRASTWACRRAQLAQGLVASVLMRTYSMPGRNNGS